MLIDARGLRCPKPVIMAQDALAKVVKIIRLGGLHVKRLQKDVE
jgi:hypothetical protein